MTTNQAPQAPAKPAEALARALATLTESKVRLVAVSNGGSRQHVEPSLLEQLALIEKTGTPTGASGGGTGTNHRSPLFLSIVELRNEIRTTTETGIRRLANYRADVRSLPLNTCVWMFAELSSRAGDEETVQALDTLRGWIHTIRNLIDPPLVMAFGVPCTNCGKRYLRTLEDGEIKRSPAFIMNVREGERSYASCNACSAVWTPSQTLELAKYLNPGFDPAAIDRSLYTSQEGLAA